MSKKKMKRKRQNDNKLILMLCVILVILLVICIGIFSKISEEKDRQLNEQSDEQFSEQKDKVNQDEVAFYEIETKYCKLYFPEMWEEQIEIRYTEEAGYKAEFYGLVEGKDEKHLFDVCFNSDDGNLLGYLENDDEIVNISIDVMELDFDDTWTQEEIDQIYSMQEEMNFVMDTLSKNENYVEP